MYLQFYFYKQMMSLQFNAVSTNLAVWLALHNSHRSPGPLTVHEPTLTVHFFLCASAKPAATHPIDWNWPSLLTWIDSSVYDNRPRMWTRSQSLSQTLSWHCVPYLHDTELQTAREVRTKVQLLADLPPMSFAYHSVMSVTDTQAPWVEEACAILSNVLWLRRFDHQNSLSS